jgi:putative SOS response-associated peptidase YedK
LEPLWNKFPTFIDTTDTNEFQALQLAERIVRELLANHALDVENDIEWNPHYNVAPGQNVPVIRQDVTRPARSISLAARD